MSGGRRYDVLDEMVWTVDAACKGRTREMYPHDAHGELLAIRICATCPVIAACADHSLANKEAFGIWGGLSERERHRRWKKLRKEAA